MSRKNLGIGPTRSEALATERLSHYRRSGNAKNGRTGIGKPDIDKSFLVVAVKAFRCGTQKYICLFSRHRRPILSTSIERSEREGGKQQLRDQDEKRGKELKARAKCSFPTKQQTSSHEPADGGSPCTSVRIGGFPNIAAAVLRDTRRRDGHQGQQRLDFGFLDNRYSAVKYETAKRRRTYALSCTHAQPRWHREFGVGSHRHGIRHEAKTRSGSTGTNRNPAPAVPLERERERMPLLPLGDYDYEENTGARRRQPAGAAHTPTCARALGSGTPVAGVDSARLLAPALRF
ncbi:hypothetical protein HPB51_022886 [Rhipicephalus microplus]|uniref:Uncharacterized protein n=1 Tax=Rhipicephalus microplus TaxID=6941 RepID=A0A9J6DRC8_RHIMP|nr:hypothetical protein HPB51_022886 [Rhipicephalus microplus]